MKVNCLFHMQTDIDNSPIAFYGTPLASLWNTRVSWLQYFLYACVQLLNSVDGQNEISVVRSNIECKNSSENGFS